MFISINIGEIYSEYQKINEVNKEFSYLNITNEEVWDMLYMMSYQLGVTGVKKFKKMLEARGVEYVDKSLDINNTEAMSEFLNLGFKALPAIHMVDQEGNTLYLGTGVGSLESIVNLYNA